MAAQRRVDDRMARAGKRALEQLYRKTASWDRVESKGLHVLLGPDARVLESEFKRGIMLVISVYVFDFLTLVLKMVIENLCSAKRSLS